MNVLDSAYKWIFNFFYGFNQPQETVCTVDDDPVECFTFTLEDQGFALNPEKTHWERVWTTNTKTGTAEVLEVYRLEDDGWKQIMYGTDNSVFFENEVNY